LRIKQQSIYTVHGIILYEIEKLLTSGCNRKLFYPISNGVSPGHKFCETLYGLGLASKNELLRALEGWMRKDTNIVISPEKSPVVFVIVFLLNLAFPATKSTNVQAIKAIWQCGLDILP
jgi:hypothetical protein